MAGPRSENVGFYFFVRRRSFVSGFGGAHVAGEELEHAGDGADGVEHVGDEDVEGDFFDAFGLAVAGVEVAFFDALPVIPELAKDGGGFVAGEQGRESEAAVGEALHGGVELVEVLLVLSSPGRVEAGAALVEDVDGGLVGVPGEEGAVVLGA